MLNNANNQWVGGIAGGAYEKPQGPADKVFGALQAFAAAVTEARKDGWTVEVTLEEADLSVAVHRYSAVRAGVAPNVEELLLRQRP